MTKTLLPHQIADAAFLASKHFAGNFSGMGSGKTLTALEAVNKVMSPRKELNPKVIIVGPPISLTMWQQEFAAHCGSSVTSQILRSGKGSVETDVDAVIMSYDIARKRIHELKSFGARVLICDESHALKTPTAKRTQAILGRGGLCEFVEHTWLLSGTPSTKYNDDLFTFLCRADNAGLKERTGGVKLDRFWNRYCVTQLKKFSARQRFARRVVVGNRNTEELNEWLFDSDRPLAVRRELAEVWAAMPPLTINRLQVRLDADASLKALLKQTEKMMMTELVEGLQTSKKVKEINLATIRRQLGVAKVKHSAAEIIDRVESGVKPILVGAWHTSVIDELAVAFQDAGLTWAIIDGRTSSKLRDANVAEFNGATVDVLVGQIGAMGVALNLQGGSHIVCVEEDFSPAIMAQFYGRCHRIGQANHVHVDVLESDTKLDRAIRRIAANKTRGHKTLMEQHP